MSFRRRLALSCGAAVAVVVVLGSALAYWVVRDTLRGEIDDALRRQVDDGARRARRGRRPASRGDQLMLLTGEAPAFVQTIRGTERRGRPLPPPLAGDAELRGGRARAARRRSSPTARSTGAHVRVYVARAPATASTIFAARSLTEVDSALGTLRWALGAARAGRDRARGAALAAGDAHRGAAGRRAHRRPPSTSPPRATSRAGSTPHGDDEVSRLATAFNTMLEALERSQRAQRQLVADASHELRTPLTSLRTNLEVLARGGPPDAGDRERLRADLVTQLEELTALVGDLVELARDEEPGAPCVEDVRLDRLVAAAVERARRHAPGVTLRDRRSSPRWSAACPARLDRAVANLLDNAAKWSPPGASSTCASATAS